MLVKTRKSEYKYLFFVIVFICLIYLLIIFYFLQSEITPLENNKTIFYYLCGQKNCWNNKLLFLMDFLMAYENIKCYFWWRTLEAAMAAEFSAFIFWWLNAAEIKLILVRKPYFRQVLVAESWPDSCSGWDSDVLDNCLIYSYCLSLAFIVYLTDQSLDFCNVLMTLLSPVKVLSFRIILII
jgi:hypothetical protein